MDQKYNGLYKLIRKKIEEAKNEYKTDRCSVKYFKLLKNLQVYKKRGNALSNKHHPELQT